MELYTCGSIILSSRVSERV